MKRRPKSTGRWKRWWAVGGLILGCGLLIAYGGRFGYVWWQIRTAREDLVLGNPDEALDALTSAAAVDPQRPELQFLLAKAHRRAGNLDRAEGYLHASFERGYSPEQVREERYLTLLQSGRMEEAQPYLSRALRADTDDQRAYEIYEAVAKGYLSTFRFRDALLCLDHFLAWKPDAVPPRLWRAEVWERQFRWEKASAEYGELVKRHPAHREARRRWADALLQLNQIREAYQQYRDCLESGPPDPQTLLGAAKCELQLDGRDAARAKFQTVVDSNALPGIRVEALIGLGQIALHERRYEDALDVLNQALAIDPGEPAARFTLASALAKSGRLSEAEEEFARADLQKKRMSRFAEITRELFDNPASAQLRWEAGRILMDQGYEKDGAAWMATALQFDPDHQATHEDLARYYDQIDRPDLAAQHRMKLGTTQDDQTSGGRVRSKAVGPALGETGLNGPGLPVGQTRPPGFVFFVRRSYSFAGPFVA